MSMLTQEVVVCTSCKTEHELGQFSCDDWWTFGKMFELSEMESEIAQYEKVDALLTRFPGLKTLNRETWKLWRDSHEEGVLEWIREKIPESINWELCDEDLTVLDYADRNYTEGKILAFDRKRDELRRQVSEHRVACPSCGQSSLETPVAGPNPQYRKALAAWSYPPSGNVLSALTISTVLFCVGLFATIGPFMTSLSTWIIGLVWCFAVPIAAIFGIAAWSLFEELMSQISTSIFRRRAHRDPLFRREATFRGRYQIEPYQRYFEWKRVDGHPKTRCELISADEDNWKWLSAIDNKHHPKSEDATATFDLEFHGTLLAVKPYGQNGRCLIEIEEIVSAKLLTVDYYDGASKELVRPSLAADNQSEQQHLLRPTLGDLQETSNEELLRTQTCAVEQSIEVTGAK